MTPPFAHAVEVVRGSAGQDRAAVVVRGAELVLALADGAGGTGNGGAAAQAVIDAASRSAAASPAAWADLLDALDGDLARIGQTTAVVASIGPHGIAGASIGDSDAWLVAGESAGLTADVARGPSHGAGRIIELTGDQIRKPMLGAGATPVPFAAGPLGDATLVIGSDGLFRYASRADIARVARGPDLAAAARALVELVRLPTGALHDDVSIVLVRAVG